MVALVVNGGGASGSRGGVIAIPAIAEAPDAAPDAVAEAVAGVLSAVFSAPVRTRSGELLRDAALPTRRSQMEGRGQAPLVKVLPKRSCA